MMPPSDCGMFDLLPSELIRLVLCFADIPSLGNLARTGKNLLAQYACDDTTWANLVERRFRIATKKSSPKLHGGHTWKHAYCSMSHSDRIPRNRYTSSSRKIVFAKGKTTQRKINGCVSLWVLMGHTENCQTRTVQRHESSISDSHDQIGDNERYVELHLCMQNVKSSAGEVVADVMDAALVLLGSSKNCDPLKSGLLRPKMLFHDTKETCPSKATKEDNAFTVDITDGVKIRPFDLVVISVHFPCSSEVYETDFLARAVSLHIPVRKSSYAVNESGGSPDAAVLIDTGMPSEASAFFIPEKDVWNYYDQLPGGCLTLVDNFGMFAA